MDEKALARKVDSLNFDRSYDSILFGGMFSIMVVLIMAHYIQNMSAASHLETTASSYSAVAGNAGLAWIQMTPLGEPNLVKVVAENSTGAFEEILLGITT